MHSNTHTCKGDQKRKRGRPLPSSSKPRRPRGNREAVRKYREKKKAHAAHLEEEANKLRALNQQLVKALQRQEVLEAEILRLRGLLLDLRGKIDNELSAFLLHKQCNSAGFDAGPSSKVGAVSSGNCQPAVLDCAANGSEISSVVSQAK